MFWRKKKTSEAHLPLMCGYVLFNVQLFDTEDRLIDQAPVLVPDNGSGASVSFRMTERTWFKSYTCTHVGTGLSIHKEIPPDWADGYVTIKNLRFVLKELSWESG